MKEGRRAQHIAPHHSNLRGRERGRGGGKQREGRGRVWGFHRNDGHERNGGNREMREPRGWLAFKKGAGRQSMGENVLKGK